jgi:hypothetical protein
LVLSRKDKARVVLVAASRNRRNLGHLLVKRRGGDSAVCLLETLIIKMIFFFQTFSMLFQFPALLIILLSLSSAIPATNPDENGIELDDLATLSPKEQHDLRIRRIYDKKLVVLSDTKLNERMKLSHEIGKLEKDSKHLSYNTTEFQLIVDDIFGEFDLRYETLKNNVLDELKRDLDGEGEPVVKFNEGYAARSAKVRK